MKTASFTLLAALLLLPAGAANAQQKKFCPEGKLANGDCVNAGLAQATRDQVIAMTQPKFSYTAPPWLPFQDKDNFVATDHREVSNFFYPPPPLLDEMKP